MPKSSEIRLQRVKTHSMVFSLKKSFRQKLLKFEDGEAYINYQGKIFILHFSSFDVFSDGVFNYSLISCTRMHKKGYKGNKKYMLTIDRK